MLIKWEGGSHKSGFPTSFTTAAFTATTILVNILSVISPSLAVPSSVPPPTVLMAKSIGIPVASPTSNYSPAFGLESADSSIVTGRRVPKQVGLHPAGATVSNADHQSAGTHHNNGFMGDHGGHGHHHHHGHHHGDGKYFMYAHNPGYDEYEYGYRRGNDYHFQERYEKYGPAWNFKTKVKWGDKYGGYGEHYWDYNHAGSGHDDGGHGHGHYSEPVPTYENQPGASSHHHEQKKVAMIYKRQSNNGDSTKKNKTKDKESKRISARQRENEEFPPGLSDVVVGDNKPSESRVEPPILVLDRATGQIIDTQTGKAYFLRPEKSRY